MTEVAKRPRVNLRPHTYEEPPVLQAGGHEYEIDAVTALLWMKTLNDFVFKTVLKGPPN